MVADGTTEVPGRSGIKPGTVLYKVLWEGWPEELATWEEEEDIPCGEVDFVAQYDAAQEAKEEGGAKEAGSDVGPKTRCERCVHSMNTGAIVGLPEGLYDLWYHLRPLFHH